MDRFEVLLEPLRVFLRQMGDFPPRLALAAGGKLLLESDKPLYQPAQIVHLRAIAMRPTDGKPLSGRDVTFSVSDPRGNRVWTETRALSEFGVAAADCPLADEITTGSYRARVSLDDDTSAVPELEGAGGHDLLTGLNTLEDRHEVAP